MRSRSPVLRFLTSYGQAPLDYGRRFWLRLMMAITFILLYAPIVTLIAFSFNDSKRNIVWKGFTLKYYCHGLEQRIAR